MSHSSLQSTIQLQSTLAATTSVNECFVGGPHHPITCHTVLFLDEDNTFRCEHSQAAPDDLRTRQAVNHSVAMLIIELAQGL